MSISPKKYAANAVEEFLASEKSNVFLQAKDTKASTLKKHLEEYIDEKGYEVVCVERNDLGIHLAR